MILAANYVKVLVKSCKAQKYKLMDIVLKSILLELKTKQMNIYIFFKNRK
jgi:hypothetical protein